ncbi:MAG: chemotaxis response regulator protein-glutamate methylesterase [Alphaproteobacteria bacterium]|nr:MAG: chemotaxis response regulator protein-glutamate methylesterase [Alphaproteobacteria bacterium]
MVVDDSAVIRGLLTKALNADPQIEVVASASNGELALKALEKHDIELVVLDIEMPVMDGMTALPLLLKAKPGIQVIMASTLTRKNAEVSLRAMAQGAADYVAKPTSTSEIFSADDFQRELTDKIKAVAGAALRALARRGGGAADQAPARPDDAGALGAKRVKEAPVSPPPTSIKLRPAPGRPPEIIAIGSSTGGPQALLSVLCGLGKDIRQPILITQHMPGTFTALLAEHIARATSVPCSEGRDGEAIVPGHIYLAPGDYHMVVERGAEGNVIRLNQNPPVNFCRPAVDPMLHSMAPIYGSRLLVIILTGMGHDGCDGAAAVTRAGGSVIAQDEATSVVWGMPGAVATAGLCSAVLPLPEIAPYVRKLAVRSAA